MRGEETPDDRLLAAFDEETEEESDEGSDFDEDRPMSPLSGPALPSHGYRQQAAPAPHMLLGLSTSPPSPGVQTPCGGAEAAAAARLCLPGPDAASAARDCCSRCGGGEEAVPHQIQPGAKAADAGAVGAAGLAAAEARRGPGRRVLPGDGRLQGLDAQQQAQLRRRPQCVPQRLCLCRRRGGHPPPSVQPWTWMGAWAPACARAQAPPPPPPAPARRGH